MRSGHGRVPVAVAVVALALCAMPSRSAAQDTGCSFTRAAASAEPEPNVRSALRCLVNVTRAEHGLRTVRSSARLNAAADSFSADMVARGYFAHVTPEGRSVTDRVRATGYLGGADDWVLGEDIGWGTGSASTPASIFRAFMYSPPHRRVILSRQFHEVGVGVAPGVPVAGRGGGSTFVLDFGHIG
jgi:uncharacterized protein YkwD